MPLSSTSLAGLSRRVASHPAGPLLFFLALCALSALAAEPLPAPLQLTPEQVRGAGIVVRAVAASSPDAATRHPGVITVPDAQQAAVAAPLPGLVERVLVNLGDEVRTGQPLLVLRSAQAHERQREALTARSQAELATAALRRDEQLHAEGLIPTARLEASRAQAQQARWLADERGRAAALDAARAEPGGRVTVTAPIAGTVVEHTSMPGQQVEPATMLLRLAALGTWWVQVQVPAAAASGLKLGDTVSLEGLRATGRVVQVARAVDAASQTVAVRARLDATEATLRLGQAVTVRLQAAREGARVLPAAAVVALSGRHWVFVERGPGRYQPVPVTVLVREGSTLSVSGVAADANVVVQGLPALKALMAGV